MVEVGLTIGRVGGRRMRGPTNCTVGTSCAAHVEGVSPFVALTALGGIGLVQPNSESSLFTQYGNRVIREESSL